MTCDNSERTMTQKDNPSIPLQKILFQRNKLLGEVDGFAQNFRKVLIKREQEYRTLRTSFQNSNSKTVSEESTSSTIAAGTQYNDSNKKENSQIDESELGVIEIRKSKEFDLYHIVQNEVEKLKKKGQFYKINKTVDAVIQQHEEFIKRYKNERIKIRNDQHNSHMKKDNFVCPVVIFENKLNQKPVYPKYLVYQNGNKTDTQLEEIRASRYVKKTHPTARNQTLKKLFLCPVMIPQPTNPREKIMYCKNKVYPGFGQDIQIEELRSRMKKYAVYENS